MIPNIAYKIQCAFVQERELVHYVLICLDLKAASPRCLMKVDLQKPYDSVHWDFLEEVLYGLHVPQKWSSGSWLVLPVCHVHYASIEIHMASFMG